MLEIHGNLAIRLAMYEYWRSKYIVIGMSVNEVSGYTIELGRCELLYILSGYDFFLSQGEIIKNGCFEDDGDVDDM